MIRQYLEIEFKILGKEGEVFNKKAFQTSHQ
jgi:hypothetical protein